MNDDELPTLALGVDGFALTGNGDYDGLPASIKSNYTFEQYQWLSGDEKARLMQTETEPEAFDD
jgi:hypothetical protein